MHRTHHDYVERLISRDKLRAERWEKLRGHVIGWSAVSSLGGLVYLLGEGIREFIKSLFMHGPGP